MGRPAASRREWNELDAELMVFSSSGITSSDVCGTETDRIEGVGNGGASSDTEDGAREEEGRVGGW